MAGCKQRDTGVRSNWDFPATSNRSLEHWYELLPNPVLAEAVLDRLVNASHHLTLEGRSYLFLKPGRALVLTPYIH